jgi:hypothetical protein
MSDGFGLVPLKMEGCPIHPDDLFFSNIGLTDEQYLKQLQAYKDKSDPDVKQVACSRPYLLDQLL